MKSRIFFNVAKLVIGFQKLSRALRALPQFRDQLGTRFHCADGRHFQRFTKIVEVLRFLRGKLPEVRATTRFNANQTLGVKAVESFTDRRLADSKLAGEKFFGESGVLVKVFAQNVSLDTVVGECGQVLRGFDGLQSMRHSYLHSTLIAT
jgi:hypothetical protein